MIMIMLLAGALFFLKKISLSGGTLLFSYIEHIRVGAILMKRHEIYKLDKWNMMYVEEVGRCLTVIEISTEWGEESHEFMSRGELEQWANRRFQAPDFANRQEETSVFMERIKSI